MLDVRRRQFITLLGSAAATWPLAARAQQPVRVYRLGLLTPTSGPTANHQALDDALTRLGYREGRNLVTERLGERCQPKQRAFRRGRRTVPR